MMIQESNGGPICVNLARSGLNYFRQSLFSGQEPTTNLVMAASLLSVIPMLIYTFSLKMN
jgi:ABC-type glycerol-3-phosphate transport system permease component